MFNKFKALRYIIALVVWLIVLYLGVCFVELSLFFAEWSIWGRAIFVVLLFVGWGWIFSVE